MLTVASERKMNFEDCVNMCLNNREFLQQYDRLSNTCFASSSTFEAQIDKATGKLAKDYKELFDFIRDYVWVPVVVTYQDEHHT